MSNLAIVSIGGGAPNKSSRELLAYGVDMIGDEHARGLIIATPKTTEDAFNTGVANATEMFASFGIPAESLHKFGETPGINEAAHKLGYASMVYITGGDTDKMMAMWQQNGIDTIIQRRAQEGMVVSGISAGAIAPFSWGHSDSLSYRVEEGESWDYIPVDGLGLIGAAVTPHYNTTPQGIPRRQRFKDMFQRLRIAKATNTGVGLDNTGALVVSGGEATVRTLGKGPGVSFIGQTTELRLGDGETFKLDKISSAS